MKRSLFTLFFLLIVFFNITIVQGETIIEPYSPQSGPADISGADRIVSFYELPLWVQVAWIITVILGFFGAIKFGLIIFGKVKTIIQNKNRAVILEYVHDNPGCTLADLSKNTGINRGTAKYHVYLLAIERKIVRQKEGKLRYLFTNSGTALEKKRVYGYIMNPAKQEILKIILDNPGISNKGIADNLQQDPSTVYWHIQQFSDEKMIMAEWDGRYMNYILYPEVEAILKEYRK
jgi:predicted transcriptional regulator